MYNVSFVVYVETGSGRSKKEAKHNTARAMLRSMEVVAPHELFELGDAPPVPAIESGESISVEAPDGESGANPVGILQELCMKMKYPPPTYEVSKVQWRVRRPGVSFMHAVFKDIILL
jgi:dsRNA-specific ribonuclease